MRYAHAEAFKNQGRRLVALMKKPNGLPGMETALVGAILWPDEYTASALRGRIWDEAGVDLVAACGGEFGRVLALKIGSCHSDFQ